MFVSFIISNMNTHHPLGTPDYLASSTVQGLLGRLMVFIERSQDDAQGYCTIFNELISGPNFT